MTLSYKTSSRSFPLGQLGFQQPTTSEAINVRESSAAAKPPEGLVDDDREGAPASAHSRLLRHEPRTCHASAPPRPARISAAWRHAGHQEDSRDLKDLRDQVLARQDRPKAAQCRRVFRFRKRLW